MKIQSKLTVCGRHLLAIAMLLLPGLALAAPIGLKLGLTSGGGTITGSTIATDGGLTNLDLAGATLANGGYAAAQTNWNNCLRYGGPLNVIDENGTNCGVSIWWDCTGIYSVLGSGTPALESVPDNKLMNAYDDSNGSANTVPDDTVTTGVNIYGSGTVANNKPWMYVTNLSNWLNQQGACSYDVVIYTHGDTSGRIGQYWIQSASGPGSSLTVGRDLTPPVFRSSPGKFTSNGGVTYTQVPLTSNTGANAAVGNFIVFPGLTADTILIRTEEYGTGTLRAPINAIQLIPNKAAAPAFNYPLPATPQTNFGGSSVTFFTPASGCSISYQWMAGPVGSGVYTNLMDGGNLSGSASARLIITNLLPSQQADYVLVATNSLGAVTNGPISLYVQSQLITGPFAQEVLYPNMTAHLVCSVTSTGVTSYAWFKNTTPLSDGPTGTGSIITGSQATNLQVSLVGSADAANYWMVASNVWGMSTSAVCSVSLLPTPTPGSFSEAVVTNSPLAYWRFDEQPGSTIALDNAGGLNGTYAASASGFAGLTPEDGYLGFDSTNGAFQASSSGSGTWVTIPALNLNTNTVTIVAWVNLNANQKNWAGILTSRHSGTAAGFNFSGLYQNALTYTWDENTAATYDANTGVSVTNNTWTMVALVVTPTNAQFYACDTNGGIRSANYGYNNNNELFYGPGTIGEDDTEGAGRAMDGLIDGVAVFNHALSPTEITFLYVAGTAAGAVPPPTITQEPLPVIELYQGQPANFSVVPAGLPPFSYQWRSNGVPLVNGGRISGATNANLTVAATQLADAANYDVIVANNGGSVTSTVCTLTFTAPTGAGYEAAVIGSAPVAYWRLGEPNGSPYAFDFYGGYTGTYGSAAYPGTSGPQPTDFPGFETTNTGVQIEPATDQSWVTAPPLNLNTNAVTIAAWIFPQAAMTTNAVGLVFQRQNLTVAGLCYGNAATTMNHLAYNWNNLTADYNWDSGLDVPINQWSFAAVVIEPSRATLYLYNTNAQLVAAHTATHALQAFDGTTYIGSDPLYPGGVRNFNGVIDEVSVWKRALSGDQIAALYTAASSSTVPPSIALQPVSTLMYLGTTNQLTVTAAGTGPYSFQWYTNGVPITNHADVVGALTPTLSFTNAALADSANYFCVVSTSLGSATSSVVAVTVLPTSAAPVFAAPATATFTALTNQTGQIIGCEDFGATEYSFSLTNGATVTTYDFKVDGSVASVVGQNSQGTGSLNGTGTFGYTSGNTNFDNVLNEYSADGGPKTITINGLIPGRSYTVQIFSLDDRDSTSGQHREQSRRGYFQDPYNATNVSSTFYMSNNFYVKATFTAAFTNQAIVEQLPGWANGFTDVGDGNLEAVVVRDTSTTAAIQYQPVSITRYLGDPATFNATVYGPNPIGYQWQRDTGTGFTNVASSGILTSSAPTLVSNSILAVAMSDAGSYRLIVTNSSGSTTSQVATLTVTLPAANTFSRALVSYGPLAYWEFNEPAGATTAHDYVGGFDGTYLANCTNGIPGLPVSFGGYTANDLAFESTAGITNSWVTVPPLNFSNNTLTIAAWLYPTYTASNTEPDWSGIFMTRTGIAAGIGYGGTGQTNSGMLAYTWNGNSSATYGFNSGLTIPFNEWSFVAVAISPTNAALYLVNAEGFQTTNNPIAHTAQAWTGAANIGDDPDGGAATTARVYNGTIDDVAVFTRTLSTLDIQNLYAGISLAPPTAPTGLIAVAGDGQAALSWNGTAETDSYLVEVSTTNGGPYSIVASNLTATTFTNTGLANGKWYYYVVAAVNRAGASPVSLQASAFPIAPTPPQLSFSMSANLLQLTWPANYTGWLLQVQTNALGAGLGTNWVTIPNSGSINSNSIPIDVTQGTVFLRLVQP